MTQTTATPRRAEQQMLFGLKDTERQSKEDTFSDYNSFVDKFKAKKTTDDCYTPPAVYAAVLDYVRTLTPLEGREIVRPFYPGGDYENHHYPDGCVVVDNPPFSIYAKIVRFFLSRGIRFFLFGPHLTLPVSRADVCYVATSASITYENGAVVNTSFVTDLLPGVRIRLAGDLKKAIERVQAKERRGLPSFRWPDNVTSMALLGKMLKGGQVLDIPADEVEQVGNIDALRVMGKTIFGMGFMVSDRVAAELRAAELRAAELRAAELTAEELHPLELSEAERAIVRRLNGRKEENNQNH